MKVEYGELVEIDFTHQIYAVVLAVGAVACILLFIFNKISCYESPEDGKSPFNFYNILLLTLTLKSAWVKFLTFKFAF